jgi:hypothetical protein
MIPNLTYFWKEGDLISMKGFMREGCFSEVYQSIW